MSDFISKKELYRKLGEAYNHCLITWGENEIIKDIIGECDSVENKGDLISRQAVLDKLNRLIEVERLQGTDEMGYGRERVSAYESMIYEIESEYLYPSVENKGEWVFDETLGEHYYCSECKSMGFSCWDYCPNCGADMRGET